MSALGIILAVFPSLVIEYSNELSSSFTILVVSIGWLLTCCLLRKRCNEKNIPGIETVTKNIICVIGIFSIIYYIALMMTSLTYDLEMDTNIEYVNLFAPIHLIFECLLLYGITSRKNGFLKAYIIYIYCNFILKVIIFVWFIILVSLHYGVSFILFFIGIIVLLMFVSLFIQFIGFTIILYNIRVNEETNNGHSQV